MVGRALRESEKEKRYHEQSLEQMMAANTRLMQEKVRAAAGGEAPVAIVRRTGELIAKCFQS